MIQDKVAVTGQAPRRIVGCEVDTRSIVSALARVRVSEATRARFIELVFGSGLQRLFPELAPRAEFRPAGLGITPDEGFIVIFVFDENVVSAALAATIFHLESAEVNFV
jgi:hypothetical protein